MNARLSPPTCALAAVLLVLACDSEAPKSAPAKSEPTKTEPARADADTAAADKAAADKAAADKAAAPPSEPAKPAEPPAPAKVEPPAPNAPGPAYFAVDKKGVVRLAVDGTFTLLKGSPAVLQKDLKLGPDGAVWLIGFEDVYRLEGDAFRSVVKAGFEAVGSSADYFAVAPNGDLWVTTFKGVSRWDGKAWTTEEKAKIGAGDDLLESIAVDRDGKVWVASTHKVHLREGDAWRDVDLKKAKGGTLYLQDLQLAPDGSVHVVVDEAVIKIGPTPGDVVKAKVGAGAYAQMSRIRFSTAGAVGILSYLDVIHIPVGGAPKKYTSERGRHFKADHIAAVAPDDGGRLWVGAETGVTILGPGDARVEWPSGSVPDLVGKIEEILVVGNGPSTLPGAGPQAKGGLTGKVLKDGAPVAGTTVELCASPSTFFTRTPCADSAVKFSAKTDADGVWTIQDVPLGSYGLAVKNGGKWSITLMSDMGDGMKAGQTYDTGSISLDKK
jgi:hypothetical protein